MDSMECEGCEGGAWETEPLDGAKKTTASGLFISSKSRKHFNSKEVLTRSDPENSGQI